LELLAHDLKNPLAALLTNIVYVRTAIANSDLPAADAASLLEALDDGNNACASMARMLGNLELLGWQLGDMPRSGNEPIDLVAIIDSLVGRYTQMAAVARVTFGVPSSAPVYANGDHEAIARAAENLLSNALQFSPPRHGIDLRFEVSPAEDQVALVIADDGPIVSDMLREEVTQWSGQMLSKSQQSSRHGRGLSLFCANLCALRTGGRIRIGERDGRSMLALILPRG
jgi:two-component system sensor histidine kinase ChvG